MTKVSLATLDQVNQLVEWTDPYRESDDVLLGTILCASNESGPQMYAVIRPALVLECLGPRPDASRFALSRALYSLISEIEKTKLQVLAFTGPNDGQLSKLAERKGFEKLEWTPWRKVSETT